MFFFFCKNMLGKLLGFGNILEKNNFEREINLKIFKIFFEFSIFLEMFQKKQGVLIPDLYFTM